MARIAELMRIFKRFKDEGIAIPFIERTLAVMEEKG